MRFITYEVGLSVIFGGVLRLRYAVTGSIFEEEEDEDTDRESERKDEGVLFFFPLFTGTVLLFFVLFCAPVGTFLFF